MVTQRPKLNLPYNNITPRERANLEGMADYTSLQSIPEIWAIAAQRFGDTIALKNPHAKPELALTYRQLAEEIQKFATGLQALGIKANECVSLFADNSPRWFIADQGIMMAGAFNAVRSAQAEKEELLFILANSDSVALVAEDLKTFNNLKERLQDLPIRLVVLLSDEEPEASASLTMLNFSGVMAAAAGKSLTPVPKKREDLATLIYTSGTTGRPKGVMLSHGNLLHQVTTLGAVIQPHQGDRVLSILPTWHSYERSAEYFLISQGCTQIYTNLRSVKQDLKAFKPHYMVAVPRLWESIYEGVQKQFREQPAKKQKLINYFLEKSQQYIEARRIEEGLSLENLNASFPERVAATVKAAALAPVHALGERLVYKKVREATGGQIKQVISGGGSLAKHYDTFFEIIGIDILVGYGLTETSPVTNARRPWCNLRGSAGQPIPGTEIKIVDPETRQPLPTEQRGLVLIRGPQVMQGYYKNPEATAKAIDSEGWFDSGDLGMVTAQNHLVLTGRAKDTIVLTNGENIEPQPIEDACLRSAYIDQIMLVGQDRRSLGAFIVPNLESLQQWAQSQNLYLRLPESVSNAPNQSAPAPGSEEITLESKVIQDLFRQELNREVQNRPGYRPDDRIGPFKLITEPFSMENGMMTQTLKIKRPVVMERYHDMIDGMFEK